MREFRFAVRLAVPLLFTYVFVGLAAGLLLRQAGYALIWVFLSAALVYAGSMQIIMVPLMTSGARLPTLALTAFLINARHIFYGIGFVEKFRKVGSWRYPFMALTVTDETYSVLCALECPEHLEEEKVQFDLLAFCYVLWVVSCTAGALLGQSLPVDLTGVDFSATLFFTTVVVDQWRQAKTHVPAVLGAVSAVLFYLTLGPEDFLLPALAVSLAVLLFLKDRLVWKEGGPRRV